MATSIHAVGADYMEWVKDNLLGGISVVTFFYILYVWKKNLQKMHSSSIEKNWETKETVNIRLDMDMPVMTTVSRTSEGVYNRMIVHSVGKDCLTTHWGQCQTLRARTSIHDAKSCLVDNSTPVERIISKVLKMVADRTSIYQVERNNYIKRLNKCYASLDLRTELPEQSIDNFNRLILNMCLMYVLAVMTLIMPLIVRWSRVAWYY
jgi:hypothetical protein